jgi:hypothetical protein
MGGRGARAPCSPNGRLQPQALRMWARAARSLERHEMVSEMGEQFRRMVQRGLGALASKSDVPLVRLDGGSCGWGVGRARCQV